MNFPEICADQESCSLGQKRDGLPKEEQESAGAEPRVCDPESRGYGVVCGHDRPAGAHV